MNWLDFERKLQRLNSRLYLQRNIAGMFNKELLSTGIYYKNRVWGFDDRFLNLSAKTRTNVDRMNSIDEYLTYCTVKHIPEGNWYNEKGEITAPGWREILLLLADKGYFSLDKARKIFRCPSLGLSSYDKLTQDQKAKPFIKKKKQKYALFNTGMDPIRDS